MLGHEVGTSPAITDPTPWSKVRRAEWARQRGEGAGLGVQCGCCGATKIYICMYVYMYVVSRIIYSHSFFIVAWLKVRQVGCEKSCLHGCCWCVQCQLYTQCSTWFNYSGDLGGEQGTPPLPRYQHCRTCALALSQTYVLQTLWYSIPSHQLDQSWGLSLPKAATARRIKDGGCISWP